MFNLDYQPMRDNCLHSLYNGRVVEIFGVTCERLLIMRIAVVAMGKIGLPLAVQFADAGHEVIGVDVNPETVVIVSHSP